MGLTRHGRDGDTSTPSEHAQTPPPAEVVPGAVLCPSVPGMRQIEDSAAGSHPARDLQDPEGLS